MSEDLTAALRTAYEGFGSGDMDAVLAVMGPQVEWDATDALAHTGTYHGHEGVRTYIEGISSYWDEYELAPDEISDSGHGEHVMVLGTVRGRLKGNPDLVELRFAHVLEMEDGKVVRLKVCLDSDAAHSALEAAESG
ncbi:MAG: nuclear transport factor 2 family protein [Solirubrobacterales bacterium]